MGVLSGRDTDSVRLQRLANRCMPKDIVRSGRLLNEPANSSVTPLLLMLTPTDHGLISSKLFT